MLFRKKALLKAFVDTSLTTNIRIIAEGIETKEELKTLILLGVHGGQGYYLKKPAKQFDTLDYEIVTRIRDYNKISGNLSEYSSDYHLKIESASCVNSRSLSSVDAQDYRR